MLIRHFFLLLIPALMLCRAAPPAHAQDDANSKRILQAPLSAAPSYAKYALVVGVTDYDSCPTLHVCGNDAKEFAELLKTKFGFTDVVLMTDDPTTPGSLRPTYRHLTKALDTLYSGILPGKSEVVLFFSGHGVRAQDLGGTDADWLVPEDGDPGDIPHTCIDYDAIKQRLDTLQPARVLLVTDACRSLLNGKAGDAEVGTGFGKGLNIVPLGPQVAELLSCQPTEVSREGLPSDFPESVFTHYLILGLKGAPDARDGSAVTFDSLKQYVQGSVHQYVASHFGNASQLPDGRASYGGMVLAMVTPNFAPPPKVTPPPVAPPPAVTPQHIVVHPSPERPNATRKRRNTAIVVRLPVKPVIKSPSHYHLARTLKRHVFGVDSVCFSPDGKRIASASWDNTIKLWDADTGQCIQTLRGHTSQVFSVCFSPDGKRIASASGDNTVKVWDADTGQCIQTFKDGFTSVCFSPDSKRVASASDDTVKLWDADTGQCIQTLTGHTRIVESVCFSPDGKRIASASWDNTVKLWDADTGQCLQTLTGHTSDVLSVCFSPDGKRIASASQDSTVKVWDADSGRCLQTLTGHVRDVDSVCFSPDGKRIASASWDNTVKLWDADTGQCLQTLTGHTSDVLSVCFSPDGKRIASASQDSTVKIWDAEAPLAPNSGRTRVPHPGAP